MDLKRILPIETNPNRILLSMHEVDRFMANKVICRIYKDNVTFDRDVTDSSISKLSNGINIGLLIKTRYVKTMDTMLSLIQRAVNYS